MISGSDFPAQDKVVAGIGAGATTLLTMDWIDTVLALIIATMTIALLGLRIALALRAWRQGKTDTD